MMPEMPESLDDEPTILHEVPFIAGDYHYVSTLGMLACVRCASLVYDTIAHDEWHAKVDIKIGD